MINIYFSKAERRCCPTDLQQHAHELCQHLQPRIGGLGHSQCDEAVGLDLLHRGSRIVAALEASEVCFR